MELTSYSAKHSVNMIPLTMETLEKGDDLSPVLMIGKFEEEMLQKIKAAYSRVISFENYPDHDDFAQIYFDHFKIGINAAKVLAGYGHKKVIHITGPDTYASALYRKNGFIRAESSAFRTKNALSGILHRNECRLGRRKRGNYAGTSEERGTCRKG